MNPSSKCLDLSIYHEVTTKARKVRGYHEGMGEKKHWRGSIKEEIQINGGGL